MNSELIARALTDGIEALEHVQNTMAVRVNPPTLEDMKQALQSLQSAEPHPPADWDTYALEKARELWALPEMPKSQLVSTIQCALLDAMAWARPSVQSAEPAGTIEEDGEGLYARLKPGTGVQVGDSVYTLPPQSAEPVAWQFYRDGKWWNGDDRISNHRANTEAAGIPTRDLYTLPQQVKVEEPWYGHKFKEVQRGIWRCECGIELAQQVKGVPVGWKLVPMEPTRGMLNAAIDAHGLKLGDIGSLGFRRSPQWMFEQSYRAMLSTSPPAPSEGKRWFAVQSVVGVHIGLWGEHRVAADVQAEHPGSVILELAEVAPSVATEWVKCGDRDPSEECEVLSYHPEWGSGIATYKPQLGYAASQILVPFVAPTHWMPLPEPPTERE